MKDSELAELAEEFNRLKRREDKAKADRQEIGQKLVKELARRKTRGITTGGWKITYVQQEVVQYDPKRLRQKLGKDFKLITTTVVDKDKLSAAVQEGLVDADSVAACAQVVPKAPYCLVNPDE